MPVHYILCLLLVLNVAPLLGQSNGKKDAAAIKTIAKKNEVPVYLEVVLKAGEKLEDLLERFDLSNYECNKEQFYKINNLKRHARLKPGTKYKMPVQLLKYNGKSIRSTLNITDWQIAKRIDTYNREALERGLREDNFLTSRDLWMPWHELNCPDQGEITESLPARKVSKTTGSSVAAEPTSSKGARVFPIFGPKYENTPLASNRLRGKVFYIVSGHGGPDPGARGKRAGHTLCEDEYAYDVSLRLLRLLISHGASAYMIVRDRNDGIRDEDHLQCDKDEKVWGNLEIPLDQRERLQQRCDLINEMTERNLKAGIEDQTLVEIHVDSRSELARTDVFFYYRPESEPSHLLALRIQRTFMEKYRRAQGQRLFNGTVTPRYLFMLRETTTPRAVYIELGNIQNGWDQQRLVIKNNRQAVANWLCDALMEK